MRTRWVDCHCRSEFGVGVVFFVDVEIATDMALRAVGMWMLLGMVGGVGVLREGDDGDIGVTATEVPFGLRVDYFIVVRMCLI